MIATFPASNDAIADSRQLLTALEARRAELPFADQVIAAHASLHQELEGSYTTSQQAVGAWRAALARRWDAEVAGRRLYKQIVRQLDAQSGAGGRSPVALLVRGSGESEISPAQLLDDLRRLGALLALHAPPIADAALLLRHVEAASADLEDAIGQTEVTERRRRSSVLDNRMARDVYQRIRSETYRALETYYGAQLPREFTASASA